MEEGQGGFIFGMVRVLELINQLRKTTGAGKSRKNLFSCP
jgi:hypothetical protein